MSIVSSLALGAFVGKPLTLKFAITCMMRGFKTGLQALR